MATKDISDLQVCLAYKECDYQRKQLMGKLIRVPFPYELLSLWTGQPEKVCYRACERADSRGYIDWGVSLRSGWLSEKGYELIGNNIGGNKDEVEKFF